MNVVYLSWPPRALWPNARVHYMALHKAKKAYAEECRWCCKLVRLPQMTDAKRLNASITFAPPDRRRRDMDNMLAAIKAGIDAVAAHVGVDDSKWTMTLTLAKPTDGPGQVRIALEAAE